MLPTAQGMCEEVMCARASEADAEHRYCISMMHINSIEKDVVRSPMHALDLMYAKAAGGESASQTSNRMGTSRRASAVIIPTLSCSGTCNRSGLELIEIIQ